MFLAATQQVKKKSTSRSAVSSPCFLIVLLLCVAAACSMITGTLLAFFGVEAPTKVSQRTLTFAERVAYQRALEDVYWRHRIWPKERPDPKPSLDAVMSQAQLEKKVQDYLRKSQALEDYWQRPLTAEQVCVRPKDSRRAKAAGASRSGSAPCSRTDEAAQWKLQRD
jgi:hypothetical protein